jgi:hypothetical protein
MATVQVALKGPTAAAVKAKAEAVAHETGVSLTPLSATASFENTGGRHEPVEVIQAFHGHYLDEAQLRAVLAPFEDEDIDPRAGVRVVVL